MLLLTDEHIPNSAVAFLMQRGHEVRRTKDILGERTRDEISAAYGNPISGVIVTRDGDFARLQRKYLRLGLIHLRCRDTEIAARLRQLIDLIEFEYDLGQNIEGSQFYVTVNTAIFFVHR